MYPTQLARMSYDEIQIVACNILDYEKDTNRKQQNISRLCGLLYTNNVVNIPPPHPYNSVCGPKIGPCIQSSNVKKSSKSHVRGRGNTQSLYLIYE